MTFEDLKALCKKGKCPTIGVLRTIEEYIINEHRKLWQGGTRRNFHDFAREQINRFEIDVAFDFNSIPKFLFNPKNAVRVYNGPDTDKDFYVVDSSSLNFDVCQEYNGYFYDNSCFQIYHEVSDQAFEKWKSKWKTTHPNYVQQKKLKWEVKDSIFVCPSCGVTLPKSFSIFNDGESEIICKICDHRLVNHVNDRPSLEEPITNYHSHKGIWKFIARKKGSEKSIPMGVELEMNSSLDTSQQGAKASASKILIDTIKDKPDYYFEWDGSLASGGFEMIANPMTLEYGVEWWSKMLPIIRQYCVGYSVEKLFGVIGEKESYNYGIHITISRKNVSDSLLAKLGKFFDLKENKEFIYSIAQRHTMYGGYQLGSKTKPKAADCFAFDPKKPGAMIGKNRGQPINIKKGLIEFRMFRSTLNTTSFLKNLEFIDAIISYYKESLGQNYHHRDFLVWLSKNVKRYPNLVEYLKHPVFFVKGVGRVKNTWLRYVKDIKIRVNDPFKEYGPLVKQIDSTDVAETAMVGE